MHGHPDVIELLNDVLAAELTAINQYFVDAKMLDNWGFTRLGEHFRHESIDEMKDADVLIERILYLEGVPNLQRLNTVKVGETPAEKLRLAQAGELDSIERVNRGIALCVTHADNGTRELLDEVLKGEESHLDWIETQLDLISRIGDAQYLAQQIRD
jgi:bacterioferritin